MVWPPDAIAVTHDQHADQYLGSTEGHPATTVTGGRVLEEIARVGKWINLPEQLIPGTQYENDIQPKTRGFRVGLGYVFQRILISDMSAAIFFTPR
jgi:hypothetical protein